MLVHGREGGDIRKRNRYMLSVAPSSTIVVAPGGSVNGGSLSCFVKDGRKISVGDCALFKPTQDSPTSVGIIRLLTSDKKSNLTLGVKWLYRPTEVKLVKGVSLEAVPNEVFYSFHWDEIPATSLLHPCKVAFLPKGSDLPAGVASFVCRRVYDITNKCLWWLSDQDFIDERQEEVDKLLHRTRIEMHASVKQQKGQHSPKAPNRSTAKSPKKRSPDCVQNSSSNIFSKTKGKKRDREDQFYEPNKREHSSLGDDGDTSQLRLANFPNLEIAKLAEKGGLGDSVAVAKLVSLMQPEKSKKKIDLAGRCMLAGIIAATEKPDYLSQFIQLKGLVVLDEWLQDVHKGKIGDLGNGKDSDKSVENFILVLLCALVKLPVNLNALQMCNIGKSVNYLRFHKNSEIQKKARSLVDTWKKRVEAEMSIFDAQIASAIVVPSPGRSKDGSSQSHSNSQCSSDHVKCLVPSGKDDVKRSTAGSKSLNKTTSSHFRYKNIASSKETAINKSSLNEAQNATDGLVHVGDVHQGNTCKLIVKIPNRVRESAQHTLAVSVDDPSCSNRRATSPPLPERDDKSDDTRRLQDVPKDEFCPARNEMNSEKVRDSSFNFMNALIETCVMLLEADVLMSPGDDVGINLLASVAVGELSGISLPAVSPHKASATAIQLDGVSAVVSNTDCNISLVSLVSSDINVGGCTQPFSIAQSLEDLHRKVEGNLRDKVISDEHATIPCTTGRSAADLGPKILNEKEGVVKDECDNQLPASCDSVANHFEIEDNMKGASLYDKSENTVHMGATCPTINNDDFVKTEKPKSSSPMEQNLCLLSLQSESRCTDEMSVIPSQTSLHLVAVNTIDDDEKTKSVKLFDDSDKEAKKRLVEENFPSQIHEKKENRVVHCAAVTTDTGCKDEIFGGKEAFMHGFDLNEGINMDEGKYVEPESVASEPRGLLTSINVTGTAEGPLATQHDLLRSKKEVGWMGSASTSAFRPAEPRQTTKLPLCPSEVPRTDGAASKKARPPLDIDLNVADESFSQESDFKHNSVCELMITSSFRSSGGLNLDLNQTEGNEGPGLVQQSASDTFRSDVSIPSIKTLTSSIFTNGKGNIKLDFDLNDGPAVEEMPVDQTSYSQPVLNNIPLQSSFGPRLYNSDARNIIAWNPTGTTYHPGTSYPPGTSYSVSVSPSGLPDREAFPVIGIGGGPHHVLNGPYKGSVLASSHALPFQPAPFQYPVFPFGTSFPLSTSALVGGPSGYMDPIASGQISSIRSQLVGNVPTVSFQYPYVASRPVPDISSNGLFDSNQKWGKQGLDLNSGAGAVDLEGIDGSMSTLYRQVSAINSQPLVEDQAMLYNMGGGILNRKEPDGGSSMDELKFKKSSWWR